MISSFRKITIKCTIATLVLIFLVGCSKSAFVKPTGNDQNQTSSSISSNSASSSLPVPVNSNSTTYINTDYGFNFSLPDSWKGYSIVTGDWEGLDITSGNITETGTLYSIRHPKWTSVKPRQDIPIMVFTLAQWELVRQEKLSVSAAPIGPSELGRNSKYVFALPARYNFAYLAGYEEVDTIIKSKALKATETFDPTTALLLNIIQLAKQGKVINIAFPVKTAHIKTVEQAFGQPNKTDVIAAKGTYATFNKYNAVFGYNKAGQIFEVRSLDSGKFVNLTLSKTKKVLGTPTSDTKYNGQEIIGYTKLSSFKIEMVFPISTINTPSPPMDHYNIIYPLGYSS